VKSTESDRLAKCTINKAMGMEMELTDFMNDADLFVKHNLLFITEIENVLCPYKDMQKYL
jgi:hypothetical protein